MKKLNKYISGVKALFCHLCLVGPSKLIFLGGVGLVSKTFYLVSFVVCIKFLTQPTLFQPYFPNDFRLVGVGLVAFLLATWAIANGVYSRGSVKLERKVARMYMQKSIQLQASGLQRGEVEKSQLGYYLDRLPKRMGKLAIALFTILMLLPVILLLVFVLSWQNLGFTLVILLMFFVMFVIMPPMQRHIRSAREELELSQKQNSKELKALKNSFFSSGGGAGEQCEYLGNYDNLSGPLLKLEKSEQILSLQFNLFTALVIILLLGWYAYNGSRLSTAEIADLVVYLISARFFCSYANQLFKQLGVLNSGLSFLNESREYFDLDGSHSRS